MMIVGKHRIKNHMSLEYNFTGIRILSGCLIPVDWHVSVDLVALDRKNKLKDDAELNASITYQKLFFWMDTNLPGIVAVDVTDEDDLYLANLSSNIMMYCPAEPYDDVIARLLHSKLSALSEENLIVGEIRIKGSDMSVQYSYDVDITGYDLPSSTADYYTEGAARDSKPWWARNDGFSFEFIKPLDTGMSDEDLFKDIVDPLDEFTKAMSEVSDNNINAYKEPARIVQVEKWKPKKV
jgi:hypothetical protein